MSSRPITSAPSQILETNLDKLHAMAEALIKYETIADDQIKDIMAGRTPSRRKDGTTRPRPPAAASRSRAGPARPDRAPPDSTKTVSAG